MEDGLLLAFSLLSRVQEQRSDSVRELTFSRLTAVGSGQSEGERELHGAPVQNRDSLAPWGLV